MTHGPNEIDIEYLNALGNTFLVNGPNVMDIAFLNKFTNSDFRVHYYDALRPSSKGNDFRVQDYDALQPAAKGNDFRVHDYDALQPSTSAYVNLGSNAINLTGDTIYTRYAPDTSEWTG